jgi:hypothetical protein
VFDSSRSLPDFARVDESQSAHADADAGAESSAGSETRRHARMGYLGHPGHAPADFENLDFPEPAVWNGGFLFYLRFWQFG